MFNLEPIDNGSYGGGGDNREQFGQGMTTAQIPMEQNGRNMMSSRGVDGPSISLRSVSGQYELNTAEYPLLIDSLFIFVVTFRRPKNTTNTIGTNKCTIPSTNHTATVSEGEIF